VSPFQACLALSILSHLSPTLLCLLVSFTLGLVSHFRADSPLCFHETWDWFVLVNAYICRNIRNSEAATAVFIYCHANGEDVGLCYEAGHWLCENLGVHVVIPEYPSYGPSPGRPNELTVYENVRATYNMVTKGIGFSPRKVIMFGRSIGTGPAIKLASELDVGGLVLVSPFVSVGNIVQHHVGFLASWLTDGLADIFPSIDLIPDAECPTLLVHGSLDTVIPVTHSEQLHSASGGICKQLVILEGIGHHGIDLHIAVVNEAPRMFALDGDPKELNIDQQLNDPSKTNTRIRAPVPAWDCYSGTRWLRASFSYAFQHHTLCWHGPGSRCIIFSHSFLHEICGRTVV